MLQQYFAQDTDSDLGYMDLGRKSRKRKMTDPGLERQLYKMRKMEDPVSELQDELQLHKQILKDLGLGHPTSISTQERARIRETLKKQTHMKHKTLKKQTNMKHKHSYKESSFGVSDDSEFGMVQIILGKQKKGSSYVISSGYPTKYRLDGNIVPTGFQFIRSWAGYDICGRTVILSKGICEHACSTVCSMYSDMISP